MGVRVGFFQPNSFLFPPFFEVLPEFMVPKVERIFRNLAGRNFFLFSFF